MKAVSVIALAQYATGQQIGQSNIFLCVIVSIGGRLLASVIQMAWFGSVPKRQH